MQRDRHKRFVHDTTKDEVLAEGEERCVTLDATAKIADDTCETRTDVEQTRIANV